jgi:thiamine pyrophosphate-dependent acetolactate synthase large subunit-like protein
MATETGSESLVRALVDAGVAVCFANPGCVSRELPQL